MTTQSTNMKLIKVGDLDLIDPTIFHNPNVDAIDAEFTGRGVNVKWFGAKGDGVTDDTVAIQTAIDSGAKEVRMPVGRYLVTNLYLRDAVRIIGAGQSTVTLVHTGSGKMFSNNTANTAVGRILLQGFSIELNANTTIGIEFARVYNSVIDRMEVIGKDCTGIGISFDDGTVYSSYYNSCYDVSINGAFGAPVVRTLGTGFRFQNSANSNRLVNCRTNYVKTGVDVATAYCNHILVTGCAFEQFDIGINTAGTSTQLFGNRFESGTTGINITANGVGVVDVGNFFTAVTTVRNNLNLNGGHFFFSYSSMSVKNLSHETNGGWTSNMDMRNYKIQNAGSVTMTVATAAPSGVNGMLAYADGTSWNPGSGAGLYLYKAGAWQFIK